MRSLTIMFVLLVFLGLVLPGEARADAADAYQRAMQLATAGRDAEAVAMLAGAAETAPEVWRERMQDAAALIAMRSDQRRQWTAVVGPNGALIEAYADTHAAPPAAGTRTVALLGTLLPGAGHAWLGRWHDAAIAALLVWPMLLLTLWSWRRGMGPLTVFLGVITLWLWSGTVFSAISLAERGSFQAYAAWWQGLWQASGLPGRPW